MIEAEIEVPGVYSGIISFLIEIVARYKISDYLSFYEIECRIEVLSLRREMALLSLMNK